MEKHHLLGLKSLVLKQKTGKKSPTSSKKPALKFQNYTTDLLSLTERGSTNKTIGINLLSPKESKNEEDPLDVLIKSIDRAVEAIKISEYRQALKILESLEKELEQEAAEGKILDRNLIIVCLYNIACVYQAMWSLENCLKYMEAVTYNLKESLAREQSLSPKKNKGSPKAKSPRMDTESRAAKLRRQNLLLKTHLQQAALLSHLERHDEALASAQEAQKLMEVVIQECILACPDLKRESSANSKETHKDMPNYSYVTENPNSSLGKARETYSLFKDEVSYTKGILEFAEPFLHDFSKALRVLSNADILEVTTMAKKSVSNWKAHCDGKQKSHRKGLSKNGIFFSSENKAETRSLLGVQHKADRLQNFNIEEVMQMHAMRYKDYAQKRTIANDLSKEALEEKVIYQSVIFFIIATEMRFMQNAKQKKPGSKLDLARSPQSENHNAELYHLKALEIVCRYITSPCAYIDHLASRYYNHYGKDAKSCITNSENQVDQEAQDTPDKKLDSNKTKEAESKESKEVVRGFKRISKENEKEHDEKELSSPSTLSLAQKITLQVALLGKTAKSQASKLKNSKDTSNNNMQSPSKKVPKIQLVSRPAVGKESSESLVHSSDRALDLPSSRRTHSPEMPSGRRTHSPETESVNSSSQKSTIISPRNVPLSSRNDKSVSERLSPELCYFGIKPSFKVPKLAMKRHEKEREAKSYLKQQSTSSYEAGFISERNLSNNQSYKMNESLDSFRKSPKTNAPRPNKKNFQEELARFEMYRESRRIVNPPTSKDNTPELIKKTPLSQIVEKEDNLKRLEREIENNRKVHYSAVKSPIKSEGQLNYQKLRNVIKDKSNMKAGTLAEFDLYDDKSGELAKASSESVEEFNRDNM